MGMSYKSCIGTIFSAVFVSVVMFYSPCCAATVSLSWDANTESTLAGYKVYYIADSYTLPFDGTGAVEGASPVDVHNQTTATVSGVDLNRTYYFAVTAYDTSGVESPYSNIVTILEAVPPTVSLSSPANNTTVSGTVSVVASASDNVGVTKAEFYVNGVLNASDTASPYVYSWDTSPLAAGSYTILAKAYDAAGNVGQSSAVSVTVIHDTIAPTVSVTAPGNGSALSGTVTITATASDNVGVSKVEFYENGVLLFASNVAPYSWNWNTTAVANGSHTLTGKAYDVAGNIGQAGNVTVTVNNVVVTPLPKPVYTISDALLALRIAVGTLNPTTEQQVRLDVAPVVNGKSAPDGKIDISDALVILSDIVGTRKLAL